MRADHVFLTIVALGCVTSLSLGDGAWISVTRSEGASHDNAIKQLADALRRNGFEVKLKSLEGRQPNELIRVATSIAISAKKERRFVVFLQGRAEFSHDGAQLLVDRHHFDLSQLLDSLSRIPDRPKEVILLVDTLTKFDAKTAQRIIEKQIELAKFPVYLIASIRALPEQFEDSSLLQLLPRALTFDRRADKNSDAQLSLHELFTYLKRERPENDIFMASSIDLPESPILVDYLVRDLETVLQDITAEAATLAKQVGLGRVLPLPMPFQTDQETAQGNLSLYMTERIRRHLMHQQMMGAVPEVADVIQALKTARIQPDEMPDEIEKVSKALEKIQDSGNRMAVLMGSYDYKEQSLSVIDLRTRFVIVEDGKSKCSIELNPTTAKLLDGHSAMTATSERLAMSRISGLNANTRQKHPMRDASFYPRVSLEVNGQPLRPKFHDDDTRMSVEVNAKDVYRIVVDNKHGRDSFLKLLVDGKNTLAEWVYDGNGKRRAGVLVSLPKARCWFCEAGKKYYFEGFYNDIDPKKKKAIAFRFEVAGDHGDEFLDTRYGDAGVITAAFHSPVERTRSSMGAIPQYATILGDQRNVPITAYTGEMAPSDDSFKIIRIEYGF